MKDMIQRLVLGVGIMMLPSMGFSQESQVILKDLSAAEAQRETTESVMFQAKLLSRLFGVPVTVDGAIPKALRVDQPWQLLNPMAPVEYGDGYENVTLDPKDRGATGFKVFSLGF